MKLKTVLTFALFFCLSSSFAPVNPISGNWTGVMDLPNQAERPVNFTFLVNNDSLTGTTNSLTEAYDLMDGKVKGDSLWFDVILRDQRKIPLNGKYYSNGDSISLNQLFRGVNVHTTLQRVEAKK
jgi:hypothetical protein